MCRACFRDSIARDQTLTSLISVVVPSFNHVRFLRACLRSVADQAHCKLELVVVDDASKDDSVEVVREITADQAFSQAFDGRITIETNEQNSGAHATINRAIGLSRGSHIAVLNSDDSFSTARLSKMMNALVQQRRRFAFSRVDFIDEDGGPMGLADLFVQRLRIRQTAIGRFPSVGFACLASNVAISTGNLLFERGLYDEIGPFSNLRYCHDWEFLLRALLVTEPLYVEDAAYNYRVHGTNSFRSLTSLAASESAAVYHSYFDRLLLERFTNRRAPSPQAWPGVFETFMTAYGLWQFWEGERPPIPVV